MKRYVVGDIHGMNTYLKKALEVVNFDYENDLLISLGDIVDRGPDVYDCVETLLKIKNKVVCLGNHDAWFIEFINTGVHPQNWLQGGYDTCNSYCLRANKEIILKFSDYITSLEPEDIPLSHKDFFRNMVPYHTTEDKKCFVHAGYDRKKYISQQGINTLTWDRTLIQKVVAFIRSNKDESAHFDDINNFNKVFIGHTPTIFWRTSDIIKNSNENTPYDKPIMGDRCNVIALDTGAVYSGALTIMDIDTLQHWQIKE